MTGYFQLRCNEAVTDFTSLLKSATDEIGFLQQEVERLTNEAESWKRRYEEEHARNTRLRRVIAASSQKMDAKDRVSMRASNSVPYSLDAHEVRRSFSSPSPELALDSPGMQRQSPSQHADHDHKHLGAPFDSHPDQINAPALHSTRLPSLRRKHQQHSGYGHPSALAVSSTGGALPGGRHHQSASHHTVLVENNDGSGVGLVAAAAVSAALAQAWASAACLELQSKNGGSGGRPLNRSTRAGFRLVASVGVSSPHAAPNPAHNAASQYGGNMPTSTDASAAAGSRAAALHGASPGPTSASDTSGMTNVSLFLESAVRQASTQDGEVLGSAGSSASISGVTESGRSSLEATPATATTSTAAATSGTTTRFSPALSGPVTEPPPSPPGEGLSAAVSLDSMCGVTADEPPALTPAEAEAAAPTPRPPTPPTPSLVAGVGGAAVQHATVAALQQESSRQAAGEAGSSGGSSLDKPADSFTFTDSMPSAGESSSLPHTWSGFRESRAPSVSLPTSPRRASFVLPPGPQVCVGEPGNYYLAAAQHTNASGTPMGRRRLSSSGATCPVVIPEVISGRRYLGVGGAAGPSASGSGMLSPQSSLMPEFDSYVQRSTQVRLEWLNAPCTVLVVCKLADSVWPMFERAVAWLIDRKLDVYVEPVMMASLRESNSPLVHPPQPDSSPPSPTGQHSAPLSNDAPASRALRSSQSMHVPLVGHLPPPGPRFGSFGRQTQGARISTGGGGRSGDEGGSAGGGGSGGGGVCGVSVEVLGGRVMSWECPGGDEACLPEDVAADVDFVVVLGGDGTVIWSCHLFGARAVPPMVPFNLGSLGFLTPFQPQRLESVLSRVLKGGFPMMLRHRLQAVVMRAAKDGEVGVVDQEHVAMNEVTVDRGMSPFLTNLECYCDGSFVTHVQGDGLIVATPTGSTAYNLGAGGSMVHPQVAAMLFTPICPHSLSFRPLIFPDHVELCIQVPHGSRSEAWCSFDGRDRCQLGPGDAVVVTVCKWPLPTVCSVDTSQDWFRSVREGLHWNLRKQQAGAGQ